MALSGLHVACVQVRVLQSVALAQKPVWSLTMANPGVTDLKAPELPTIGFEIRSASDAFVAIGPNPDAAADARIFVPAGDTRNIFCDPGDRLAWIAA